MKDSTYVLVANLVRLREIEHLLHELCPTKSLPEESIRSFQQWCHRMVDRHHGLVDLDK